MGLELTIFGSGNRRLVHLGVVSLKEMIKDAFQTLPPPAELEGAGNGKHYKDQEM